ncbi:hypothetical protein GUITHDRAFT_117482 [Guillardia theta CCMP2712]|uniref:Peptidase C14 caspase domain-containing protein n=1 Tax=Guillardia theta (strain CCMP2712) TaxID=905079 RepID=L1IJG8_GUITC|nr:hypothetical protein GUITHDRAFT_117482 [Guillardia theta CCMP2712]EKX36371.1 hypothetical protein GUITHDRAFT_117482 [Guillardia theta CCMP2712]|eukprot:XP_005823351.1 hypothetical protein GUITHDRAFT_117482 [Guillardia theta CCMP2712]
MRGTGRVKALCIGADAYTHIAPLVEAVKDARRMHRELEDSSGCSSSFLANPTTRQSMLDMLSSLAMDCQTKRPELMLVFYAGHAIQLSSGEIAMLTCDVVRPEVSEETRGSRVTVGDVLSAMAAGAENVEALPPLIVIIDACRDEVQGRERIESEITNRTRSMKVSLFLSCSRGQRADDESAFLRDLLDKEDGMFARNMRLKQAIQHAMLESRRREQVAVSFCTELIPEDLCIRPEPTVLRDIQQIQQGARRVAESSRRLEDPTAGPTSPGPAAEVVAGYSPAAAGTGADAFRSSILGLLQESLGSLLEESPRWRVCSMFVLVFLRYEGTRYGTQVTRRYYQTRSKKRLGPDLIRAVNGHMSRNEIRSEELEQWVQETYGTSTRSKTAVAAIDFAVREEIRRSLSHMPEEARSELRLWEEDVRLRDFYEGDMTEEAALNEAEGYLKNKMTADQDGRLSPLLAVHVLSRVVETGSFVTFLKMTRLSCACLSVALAKRVRVAGQGYHEHGELEERLEKEEAEQLRALLAGVGGDEEGFVAMSKLEGGGALTVWGREQEVDSQVGEELKKLSVVPVREIKTASRLRVHQNVMRSESALSQASTASVSSAFARERHQRILSALLDKPELSDALEPFDNISPGDTWENVRGKVKYEDVVRVGKALMKEAELIAGDFKTLMRSKQVEKLLGTSVERPTDVKDFERKINARWGPGDIERGPYKIWAKISNRPECFLSRLERYLNEFLSTEERQADLIVAMAYLSTFNWCLTSKPGKPIEYALPSDQKAS